MVKKRADILFATFNSIKLCVVICIVFLVNIGFTISATTVSPSVKIDNILKLCEGDVFIMQVFDETIPVSSVDSLYFIRNSDTLKFISPKFTGKDTLFLEVNSAALNMTGNITIWTFVLRDGKPQKRISYIRIVAKPQIITHPIDRYACQSDPVKFSFTGSNYDSIRWEFISPNSSQWNFYGNESKSELIISANKQINTDFHGKQSGVFL